MFFERNHNALKGARLLIYSHTPQANPLSTMLPLDRSSGLTYIADAPTNKKFRENCQQRSVSGPPPLHGRAFVHLRRLSVATGKAFRPPHLQILSLQCPRSSFPREIRIYNLSAHLSVTFVGESLSVVGCCDHNFKVATISAQFPGARNLPQCNISGEIL